MRKLLLLTALISFTFLTAQNVDFEDDTTGAWTFVQTNASETFTITDVVPGNGNPTVKSANCLYDPALNLQDERIVSPAMDFTSADNTANVTFYYMMSYHWGVSPNNNYDMNLLVSTDAGTTWSEIWDETMDPDFTSTAENYLWRQITVDLSAYIGQADVRLAFQYLGTDGAQGGFDEIVVSIQTANTNENILANQVSIYPTTVANNFTIKNSSDLALVSATIFDVNGRLIASHNLNNLVGEKIIDVANLTAGMYFVEIQSANNKLVKKIIKK